MAVMTLGAVGLVLGSLFAGRVEVIRADPDERILPKVLVAVSRRVGIMGTVRLLVTTERLRYCMEVGVG